MGSKAEEAVLREALLKANVGTANVYRAVADGQNVATNDPRWDQRSHDCRNEPERKTCAALSGQKDGFHAATSPPAISLVI